MFFRMRRQHAFELNRSLERAMAGEPSGSKSMSMPSSIGSDGGGRDGGGSSRDEHQQRVISMSSSGSETASGVRERGVLLHGFWSIGLFLDTWIRIILYQDFEFHFAR